MKLKLVSFSALFAILLTGPTLAGDSEPHAYVTAAIGRADTEFRPTSFDKIDGDDTAWEIGVGYTFNQTLAIEVSYQDFGEPQGSAGCPPGLACVTLAPFALENVDVDGWSAVVKASVPIAERFSAFGKLGLLAWDASANNPGLNDSGTDLLVGIGLAAELNDKLDLQLSFDRANVDINTFKLGLRLRF